MLVRPPVAVLRSDEAHLSFFKTGDIGIRDAPSEGGYRVLGRLSVDIIKVYLSLLSPSSLH